MAKRKQNKLNPVGTYAESISDIRNRQNKVGTYRQNVRNNIDAYLKRIREDEERRKEAQHQAITKSWQDASREARYSPDGVDRSYEIYAAKMMHESPGTMERLQKEAEATHRQKTQDWQKAAQEAKYSQDGQDRSYQVYAAKQIADSSGSAQDKLNKVNDFLAKIPENKLKKQATDLVTNGVEQGGWLQNTPEETSELLKTKNAKAAIKEVDRMKHAGEFDELDDPGLWTTGKRTARRNELNTNAAILKERINQLDSEIAEGQQSGNRWDAMLELYTTPEVENERKILAGEGYSEEAKQKAQDTLNMLLNKNTGAGTQTATERAKNFIKYNADNMSTLRDSMDMKTMRRMIYDNMNGDGAYEQTVSGMNQQERIAFDQRLDAALDYVADPNGKAGVEKRTAEMQLKNVEEELNRLDYYDRQDEKYNQLMTTGAGEDTAFHAENALVGNQETYFDKGGTVASPVDYVYANLGGIAYSDERDITTGSYREAELMDDTPGGERDIFMSLYNSNRKDEAWAFYEGLRPSLNQRMHYFEQISQEATANQLPVMSSVASLIATPVQTAEFLRNLPGQVKALITGEDSEYTDPYSGKYTTTRMKNLVREKITNNLGDWGWVYQGLMSGADSAFNSAIGMGLGLTGNALQYGVLALFGTQAFETSLQNNMASGNNYFAYDWIEAFIDSAIETATEVWSVENWLADPKNILTYVGKIAISEPSEEIVGAIVEPYIKEMLGHGNKWDKRAQEILGAGGYYDASGKWIDVKDADAAKRQAMREWNHEIRMSAQEALMSIGPAAMYGSTRIALENIEAGAQIQSRENGLRQLVTAGQQLDANTDSYQLAQKMQGQLDENKRINKYETGKLAGDIIREGMEQAQTKEEKALWDRIAEDVKDAENADELTEIITKALKSEEGTEALTKKERKTLNASQDAMKTYYKYRIEEQGKDALQEELSKATENEQKALKSVAELVTKKKPTRANINITKFATQDDIRQAEAQSTRTKSPREVIVDGKFASVKQVRVEKVNDKWQAKVELEDGRTVETSQLLATNYGVANIINQATISPEFFSEKYTNLLMKAQEEGRMADDQKALDDAAAIRIAAYIGNTVPQTSLDRQLANEIWTQSVQEHAENGSKNTVAPVKGTVKYKGMEYGTTEYNKAVKEIAEPTLRNAVDMIGSFFHKAGLELNMDDMQDDSVYGTYDTKTQGISINLFGKNYTVDGEADTPHNIVVTAGHELTHWLKDVAPAAYKRLEQYVMQSYAKKDYNELVKRLNHFMYQDGLDLEGAIDEIVANSSDQVLGDEKTVNHIRETDTKLFDKLRDFVQVITDKVKSALFGMQESASKDARFMIANGVNRIHKLWWGTFDEALSRAEQGTTAKAQPAEGQKFSKAETQQLDKQQLDDEYSKAMESGNVERQTELVQEAARRAGYTEKVFHGSDTLGFTVFDMDKSRGEIFVGYSQDISGTYTRDTNIKQIKDTAKINFDELDGEELENLAMETITENDKGWTLWNIELNAEQSNEYGYDVFDLTWDNNDDIAQSSYVQTVTRDALEKMIESRAKYMNKGVYQLFARPGKQLVVDAEGATWHSIPVDFDQQELSTREIADFARGVYDSVRINDVVDWGGRGEKENGRGDIGIYFNQNDVKSADPVTYDDDGNVIPLSKRFAENPDLRYSKAQLTPEQEEVVTQAEQNGIDLDVVNHTASKYSRASWRRSDYFTKPDEMAEMLALNVLGDDSPENIEKARKFIKDINSVSDYIGEHSDLLDYIASEGRSSFKSNPEYGGSIDSSTLCPKRWWQTGTIDAIQRAMPDYALTAEDFLRIRNMMKERGYEVSCGLCFVESSRKNIAKYAKQFMNEWNSQHPENKVNMIQINTVMGLEDTRKNNREVYEAYEKFMNKLAQRKPKLFEMRAEYNNDILKHFRNDESVEEKNKHGGMRINSFSDFEIVHLIDMMQVIMDMANVGLAGQAYTKVREFAEALGPSGLKINMSMIAKGVDKDGRIIFDEVEGMKWEDVKDLRDKYADNVGTILVVFTEEQLMAAMNDDRIDFIIPFHRSQWNKSNYKDIGLPDNTKDFTYWQNERYRTPVYKEKKDGTKKKVRATNYMPNEYWDFNLSGKENAERYLQKCWEENKIPKFWKWLDNDGKGRYSLKADGSTDGYWKLLIDFKMYNHITGEGAKQNPVVPVFDMDASQKMLEDYKGGHSSFPEAKDVVRDFVKEKESGSRKGIEKKNGKIKLAGNEIAGTKFSKAEDSDAMDAGLWLATVSPWSGLQTEDERTLQQAYKDRRLSISLNLYQQNELKEKIRKMEAREILDNDAQRELENMRNKLEQKKAELAKKEAELQQITSKSGFAGKMYQERMILSDYVAGRTQDQVLDSVESMLQEVEEARKEIAKRTEELKELANTQAVKTLRAYLNKGSLKQQADTLAETWQTAMPKTEIQDRLAAMALKLANGQDITAEAEALATDMMNTLRGVHNEELENLRGVTLTIGKSLAEELKAENSSLKEIQQQIRGSGVRIIEGEENSRLVTQWNDLRENNKSLPEASGNDIDVLHDIVDFITGQMQGTSGEQVYGEQINMEEVTAAAYVAAASVSLNMVQDPAAKRLISGLMKQIKELSQKQGQIVDSMTELNEKMTEAMSAGVRAKSWAGVLQNDVDSAIKYYNEVAKLAAKEEKAKVRKDVAEHLRSENAKKLYEQQDKYNQMLKDSRKARETAEENKTLRNRINTNISRLRKRLTEEKDRQNIPEETKALARYLCGKLVNHDMTDGLRRILFADKKQLEDFSERLKRMAENDGEFDAERDLDWLVIKAPNAEDNDYTLRDKVMQDLRSIDNGLLMYWTAEGNGLESLQNRRDALKEISDAVAEISSAIRARGQAFINNKRYELADLAERAEDEMSRSKFKGERYGRGSKAKNAVEKGIAYGNMTPVYFFKNLKNSIMDLLHQGFNSAENRSGLMAAEAQARMEEIAEQTGFRTWDGQEKHEIEVNGGRKIEITTEQLMALYATWQREKNNLRPEETAHLLKGGFVMAREDTTKGKPGRERVQQRPVRMSKEQLDRLGEQLTDQQREFVDKVVQYMSTDLAEVANETSMETYGIKKFTEKYYFPIKSWRGVLSQESNRGITNQNDNAAMRQSFTKRITAGAQNAIEIGDFTATAMKHIAGMITYNTVGPAVENLNRVLNYQLSYGDVTYDEAGEVAEDDTYKRSVRAAFQEAYGKNALDYLAKFMQDVNGGTAQGAGNTVFDKLLSTFRKGAVAGSLSVAAQQPLAYIRAAMLINPKYLASAIAPWHWGKIHEEMTRYSGIAVIKDMGRFDMQIGRSMLDYITPDGKESGLKTAWTKFSDATTVLPEKMDAITWGRMWVACKMEQAAQNPGVDQTSEAFLQKVAERFNEVMRRTQVYDSVMVKSQNMREKNHFVKGITSFMAEPTLTLNVLADAAKNIGEKGGKLNLAKAGATFLLSAVMQALVKGIMSSGRSPDKKKTWMEQFLAKWFTAFLSEANPASLVPGYSDIVELLKNGELNNDAMGVIGKIKTIGQTAIYAVTGNEKSKGVYRDLEDTVGQVAQIFTNIPVKNIMRDVRAMYNFFNPDTYANRETSGAVIKYSVIDAAANADNMVGVVNTYLQMAEAGYGTSNADYYKRLYEAQKNKDEGRAKDLKEYLQLGKGVKEETIKSKLKENAKADDSLTAAQRDTWMIDNDLMKDNGSITTQYKKGELSKEEAKKLYKKLNPKLTENELWWKIDQLDYQKETGAENVSGYSYRLKDAIRDNKEEAIKKAVKAMLDHGRTKEQVKNALSDWKSEYLAADTKTRNKIRDALQKAYKDLGLTAEDANKTIEKWKKDAQKKTNK